MTTSINNIAYSNSSGSEGILNSKLYLMDSFDSQADDAVAAQNATYSINQTLLGDSYELKEQTMTAEGSKHVVANMQHEAIDATQTFFSVAEEGITSSSEDVANVDPLGAATTNETMFGNLETPQVSASGNGDVYSPNTEANITKGVGGSGGNTNVGDLNNTTDSSNTITNNIDDSTHLGDTFNDNSVVNIDDSVVNDINEFIDNSVTEVEEFIDNSLTNVEEFVDNTITNITDITNVDEFIDNTINELTDITNVNEFVDNTVNNVNEFIDNTITNLGDVTNIEEFVDNTVTNTQEIINNTVTNLGDTITEIGNGLGPIEYALETNVEVDPTAIVNDIQLTDLAGTVQSIQENLVANVGVEIKTPLGDIEIDSADLIQNSEIVQDAEALIQDSLANVDAITSTVDVLTDVDSVIDNVAENISHLGVETLSLNGLSSGELLGEDGSILDNATVLSENLGLADLGIDDNTVVNNFDLLNGENGLDITDTLLTNDITTFDTADGLNQEENIINTLDSLLTTIENDVAVVGEGNIIETAGGELLSEISGDLDTKEIINDTVTNLGDTITEIGNGLGPIEYALETNVEVDPTAIANDIQLTDLAGTVQSIQENLVANVDVEIKTPLGDIEIDSADLIQNSEIVEDAEALIQDSLTNVDAITSTVGVLTGVDSVVNDIADNSSDLGVETLSLNGLSSGELLGEDGSILDNATVLSENLGLADLGTDDNTVVNNFDLLNGENGLDITDTLLTNDITTFDIADGLNQEENIIDSIDSFLGTAENDINTVSGEDAVTNNTVDELLSTVTADGENNVISTLTDGLEEQPSNLLQEVVNEADQLLQLDNILTETNVSEEGPLSLNDTPLSSLVENNSATVPQQVQDANDAVLDVLVISQGEGEQTAIQDIINEAEMAVENTQSGIDAGLVETAENLVSSLFG